MKTMKFRHAFGLALLAAAAAGCASTRPRIADVPAPGGRDLAPEPSSYTVSDQAEMMKIALSSETAGSDEHAADFAAQVREIAVGALRDRKFNLVSDGSEDLRLALRSGVSIYDNSADTYFTLDGSVSARLDDAAEGTLLAEKTLRGRNKAALGMPKAVRDVAAAMKPEIEKWIAETVTPEQVPLEARTLKLTNTDRYRGGESAFIEDFVKAISKMDGVLRCETAARDGEAHTAAFRVLYRRAKYPQGFVHAVVNQNPSFGLKLK